MTRSTRFVTGLVAAILLVGGGALLAWLLEGPSATTVRRTVIATVQEEAAESFYVTGSLQLTATIEERRSEGYFGPVKEAVLAFMDSSLAALNRGEVSVELRVPGRVSYGFDVSNLQPEMIQVRDGNRIELDLPALSVYSVEPDLGKLEVRTASSGWIYWFGGERRAQQAEQRALAGVRRAFEEQAQAHLESATQPKINTARALVRLLEPTLRSTGVSRPRFRVRIGPDLVLTPDPTPPDDARRSEAPTDTTPALPVPQDSMPAGNGR
jgi:hypothetical protein